MIPEDQVGAARESELRGRELLQKDGEAERRDGINQWAQIPGEFQVSAPAGSVLMQDTCIWHSGALNPNVHERTAVVCRYAPWWLSGNEFGNLHSGGHTLRTYVPREVYAKFSPELQLLYRHLAEGEEDVLQPGNQHSAARARALRGADGSRDNSHVVAGAVSREEWERARSEG